MEERTGNLLKLLRIVRRLNQRELADRAGVHSTTISAYEAGTVEPNETTIRKVLAGLGCTPLDLEMVDEFCRVFRLRRPDAEPAPPDPAELSTERRQALELAIASGRLAYHRTKFELELLLRIEEAVRAEAAGEAGTA